MDESCQTFYKGCHVQRWLHLRVLCKQGEDRKYAWVRLEALGLLLLTNWSFIFSPPISDLMDRLIDPLCGSLTSYRSGLISLCFCIYFNTNDIAYISLLEWFVLSDWMIWTFHWLSCGNAPRQFRIHASLHYVAINISRSIRLAGWWLTMQFLNTVIFFCNEDVEVSQCSNQSEYPTAQNVD